MPRLHRSVRIGSSTVNAIRIGKRMKKLLFQPIVDSQSANAFLLGIVFNQNQRAERSWAAPRLLWERLETADPGLIAHLPISTIAEGIAASPALHPFSEGMAGYVKGVSQLLIEQYQGDARNIWTPAVPAQEIIDRLIAFPGIGKHKATIALYLLVQILNVSVLDDGTQINIRTACPNLARVL